MVKTPSWGIKQIYDSVTRISQQSTKENRLLSPVFNGPKLARIQYSISIVSVFQHRMARADFLCTAFLDSTWLGMQYRLQIPYNEAPPLKTNVRHGFKCQKTRKYVIGPLVDTIPGPWRDGLEFVSVFAGTTLFAGVTWKHYQ